MQNYKEILGMKIKIFPLIYFATKYTTLYQPSMMQVHNFNTDFNLLWNKTKINLFLLNILRFIEI